MVEFHLPPPRTNFTGEFAGFSWENGKTEVPEAEADKAARILERFYGCEREAIDPEEWAARHDEDAEFEDEEEEFDPALPGDTTKPVSGSEDVKEEDDEAAPRVEGSLPSPEDFASMTRTELSDRAKQNNIDPTGLTKKQIIEKLEEIGFHGRINS